MNSKSQIGDRRAKLDGDLVRRPSRDVQSIEDGGSLAMAGIVYVDCLDVSIPLAIGHSDRRVHIAVSDAHEDCVAAGRRSAKFSAERCVRLCRHIAVRRLLNVTDRSETRRRQQKNSKPQRISHHFALNPPHRPVKGNLCQRSAQMIARMRPDGLLCVLEEYSVGCESRGGRGDSLQSRAYADAFAQTFSSRRFGAHSRLMPRLSQGPNPLGLCFGAKPELLGGESRGAKYSCQSLNSLISSRVFVHDSNHNVLRKPRKRLPHDRNRPSFTRTCSAKQVGNKHRENAAQTRI